MATPGRLVTKLSQVLAIPEGTLTAYDRVLREAGLLTKAGRGRGSTQRTPLDAAQILIALLSTSSPARAAEVVNDFGILEYYDLKLQNPESLTLADLCGEEFTKAHTFEHALSAIISGFGQNGFQQALNSNAWSLDDHHSFLPHLGVTVWDTKLAAMINVAGNMYIYHHPLALELSSLPACHPSVSGRTGLTAREFSVDSEG